jgi:hypothetical protein
MNTDGLVYRCKTDELVLLSTRRLNLYNACLKRRAMKSRAMLPSKPRQSLNRLEFLPSRSELSVTTEAQTWRWPLGTGGRWDGRLQRLTDKKWWLWLGGIPKPD